MVLEDAIKEAEKFQSLVYLHSRFDEARSHRAYIRNLRKTDQLKFEVPKGTKRVILLKPPTSKKCGGCPAGNTLVDLMQDITTITVPSFISTYSVLEPRGNYADSVADHASDIINWFTREELTTGYDFLKLLLENKHTLPENIMECVELVISDFYVDNFFEKENVVGFNMHTKFGFCAIIPK